MDKILFIKELQELISKDKLRKVLEKIIQYATAQSANKTEWTKVRDTALHNLSRLSSIENQRGLGLIRDDDYSHEANNIRWTTIKLVGVVNNEQFDELSKLNLEKETPPPGTQSSGKTEHNLLDNIFKFLLLFLFLVSIIILIRSLVLSDQEREERVLQGAISLLGGSGAFIGYFRWRLLELGQ